MTRLFTLLLVCATVFASKVSAQFSSVVPLKPLPSAIANTGEKPQSKVWYSNGSYWSVLATSEGTFLWKLENRKWLKSYKLSDSKVSKADCKVVGNNVHVLLFQGATSQFMTLQFSPDLATYRPIASQPKKILIPLDETTETATIDVDGTGKMWLAFTTSNTVQVVWSDYPYTSWSPPMNIAEGVEADDICAVVHFAGKTGVFWSNQHTNKFGFKTHTDGDATSLWSADEAPAAQSALNVGHGMADDHMNMAVASDGTLYCTVKTSYDNTNYPEVALLVRRTNGTWDQLYSVSELGTRPIVLLNEKTNKIRVVYTTTDNDAEILYKETATDKIAFGDARILIEGKYNNATSTKDNFSEHILILASNTQETVGVIATDSGLPLLSKLIEFNAKAVYSDALLEWTLPDEDTDHFNVEVSTDGFNFATIGTVPATASANGHYLFTDPAIFHYRADQIYYRLRQTDKMGDVKLSSVRAVSTPVSEATLLLQVHPNPFTNQFKAHVFSQKEQLAYLTLYNAQGRQLATKHLRLSEGTNEIDFSSLQLAQDIYFLSVVAGQERQTQKLVRW